jgi:hypothetical protein
MSCSDYNTSAARSTKAVKLKDGRTIGWIENNRFIKPVAGSKHRLNQPPAWAIDADLFEQQVKANANEIIIWDVETDTLYISSVCHFDRKKVLFNRGFGAQYFLKLTDWEVRFSRVIQSEQKQPKEDEKCSQISFPL